MFYKVNVHAQREKKHCHETEFTFYFPGGWLQWLCGVVLRHYCYNCFMFRNSPSIHCSISGNKNSTINQTIKIEGNNEPVGR